MIKRLALGLLMTMGLGLTSLLVVAAPASAQAVARSGSSNPYSTVPASSTTDPCLTGNGATNTVNINCSTPSATSSSSQAANTVSYQTPTATSGGLAFTGADVIGTVVIAFVLIVGGLIVVRASRQRQRT